MLYQQGDVLIESVKGIPPDAKKIKRKNGRLILAEGEATGHAHAITMLGAMLLQKDNNLFLKTTKETEIVHEEHNTITIPIGNFIIRRVLEYDHFAEEAKVVMD